MAKGALDRIATIWKSNLNEVLDRIEDPIKMVDQIARDVEDAVDQAIAALAAAMANQRRIEREVHCNSEQIQAWQGKAEMAVEAGDEDYARLVLAQMARLEQANVRFEPALAESEAAAAQLRVQVEQLRGKLQQVRERRQKLFGSYRASQLRGDENSPRIAAELEAVARFAAVERKVHQRERDLARFEERSEQLVAEAEVQRELAADRQVEKELNQVERERWVEEELMTLKADKVS